MTDGDLRMLAECHAVESRHRLALTARRDEGKLARRISLHFVHVDKDALRNVDVSQTDGSGEYIEHASAGDSHFSAVLG